MSVLRCDMWESDLNFKFDEYFKPPADGGDKNTSEVVYCLSYEAWGGGYGFNFK